MYRFADHTADLAIEIESDSLEELVQDAVRALIEILTGNDAKSDFSTDCLTAFKIEATGFDIEEVLVSLLNEILFHAQTLLLKPLKIVKFNLTPEQNVSIEISAEEGRGGEHLRREIKAVTYHDLKVTQTDKWRVRIVFDV